MTRSSSALLSLGFGLILSALVACGGDNPEPKVPETTPPAADTDAGAPAATSDAKDPAATASAEKPADPPPPPPPPTLALPSASAKLKFKTAKAFDVEVKSDGSVMSGGKAAAKIAGMELQDKDGKAALKVADDGAVTTATGDAYGKFDGDMFTTNTNVKYDIADDGAMSSTDDKGKKTSLGKTEGVGSAKRSSLLAAAYAMWGMKAPAAPAAKPAAGAAKPAAKPAAAKPPAKK